MRRLLRRLNAVLATIALALCLSAASVAPAHAYDAFNNLCSGSNDTSTNASGTDICKEKASSNGNPVINGIKLAINFISIAIGVAAVIGIMVGSLRMIINGGDPNAVSSAKRAVVYSVVGIFIAGTAQIIVYFVINKL